MSNINLGQFLNNFMNNFNQVNNNGVQNSQINPKPQPASVTQQNTPLTNLLPNYVAQFKQTAAELAMLNEQETINMLKDLLKFPKNFDKMIAQLVTDPKQANQKIALILLASNLDISKLSNLLKTNSKEAMTNLYQMMAQFNQVGMQLKDEQLSQITKLISFVAASTSSDVQTLKTTMLMYLPWLPLTDPNVFQLEITNKGGDNGSNSDDFVTILLATENYGNIQADVYKTNEDGIKIELISSETFPQENFVTLMKEESIKYNININFGLAKKEVFNKEKVKKSETQVFMNTSPGVNPFLLLISNSLIKNVHFIDNKENLKTQRKEKIDNGKSQD